MVAYNRKSSWHKPPIHRLFKVLLKYMFLAAILNQSLYLRESSKTKPLALAKTSLTYFTNTAVQVYTRVFQMWHFVKKKNCDASTIPSRAYINHIQKNFFPRTSLEGRPTWSKIGHPAVSICRKNLFFNNNTTPVNSLRGSQERLQHFFCSNTLPFFATDTYKLVAQGSLFIWVYSDYLSFSI